MSSLKNLSCHLVFFRVLLSISSKNTVAQIPPPLSITDPQPNKMPILSDLTTSELWVSFVIWLECHLPITLRHRDGLRITTSSCPIESIPWKRPVLSYYWSWCHDSLSSSDVLSKSWCFVKTSPKNFQFTEWWVTLVFCRNKLRPKLPFW